MGFILFNVVLFIVSLILTYKGFANYKLFLELPASLEILIVIGFVTPIMNLYNTIRNFVTLSSILSLESEEEE
jgi:hypothetical protein